MWLLSTNLAWGITRSAIPRTQEVMYPTPFSTDEIISSVYILKRDVVEKLAYVLEKVTKWWEIWKYGGWKGFVLGCVTDEDKDWGETWLSCPSRLLRSGGYRLAPPTSEGRARTKKERGQVKWALVQDEKELETTKQTPKRQTLCHRLGFDKDCMLFI